MKDLSTSRRLPPREVAATPSCDRRVTTGRRQAMKNPSPAWCRYHPDILKNCPEMAPYFEKAKTPFGKLGLMMVSNYAPFIESGSRSQEDMNSVFLLAALMSGIPAEALLAFTHSLIAAKDKQND